jgi:hypothetical protein
MAPTHAFPIPSRKITAEAVPYAFLAAAMMIAGLSPVRAQPSPPATPPNIAAACGMARPSAAAGAPLTVEVRDEFGPYRSDQVTMVSDSNGLPLVTLTCDGALSSFRLAPGIYRVMAFVGEVGSMEFTVNVPPEGTKVSLRLESAPGRVVNSPALD